MVDEQDKSSRVNDAYSVGNDYLEIIFNHAKLVVPQKPFLCSHGQDGEAGLDFDPVFAESLLEFVGIAQVAADDVLEQGVVVSGAV
jgi:hypothetical protein